MKKTKSKRTKGLEFQRWIKKWLEERGWHVHNQSPCAKIIRKKNPETGRVTKVYVSVHNDIMGCDLIARRPGRLLWIQATTDTNIQRKVQELQKHFTGLLTGESLQIWVKNPKGEVNIKSCYFTTEGIRVEDSYKIVRGKLYSLSQRIEDSGR